MVVKVPEDVIPTDIQQTESQQTTFQQTKSQCRTKPKETKATDTIPPDKVNRRNPNRKYQQTKSNIQALVYNLITRKSILQVKLITFYSRLWVWSHPLNGHILFNGPSYPRTESFLLR